MKKLFSFFIIYVIVCSFLISCCRFSEIIGDSMSPNIQEGDRVVICKWTTIERFDVITIKWGDMRIIKRVIGLPGETIELNHFGIKINEAYIIEPFLFKKDTYSFYRVKLADDEYFVLGDNRPVSLDSRIIGPVKIGQVEGEMILKW